MPATPHRSSHRRRVPLFIAALTAILLVATACGGDGDSGGSTASPPPAGDGTEPASQPDADAPATAPGAPASPPDAQPAPPDAPATAPDAPAATPDAPPAPADAPPPPPGDPPPPPPAPVAAPEATSGPVYGGTLTFGVEAETPDGWNPATTQCAVSCHAVMRAVFDPLVVEDETGAPQPYLLESFEANDDFTVWTLRMRPGIRFHDGTPAGADSLAVHVQNLKAGALTGQLLRRIESWEVVDDLTLKVYSNAPFAGLVSGLTGQFGYLPAPSQYADPDGAANPVGTGPFVFESWIPDQELVVERNADYWRADAEGNALPYLDRIVFRPIIEPDARKLAMQTGDIDVTHSDIGLEFDEYRENFKTVEERSYLQTFYLLMNNARPPFNDIRARQALAHCTDHETYNLLRTGGNFDIANGPFGPNTPGYLADTGFPAYDLEAGRALWSQVDDPGTITLGTSNDAYYRTGAELLAQMWDACGIDVEIQQVDQGALILNAVMGNFQVFQWRNHSGVSLENERVWWHSEYASGLAINFGRIVNPQLDAALDGATRTDDPAALAQFAEEVNRIFAADVHNVWLHWVRWLIPHREEVQNLGWITLPSPAGREVLNILTGKTFLTETWIEQ